MKKIFLSMSLMAALFFVSCDQNSANDEVQGSTSAYQTSVNGQAKLSSAALTEEGVNCTPVSDNAVVNRTGTTTGDYCGWAPTAKTIGLVGVRFEGIYGSALRPTDSGWYVGVVDPSYECEDGWSTIAAAINVKNNTSVTPSNVGSDPSCPTFTPAAIPQNVVGAQGAAYGYNFSLGYYNYDSSTRVITITKKIVIWQDANLSAATAYSDPTTATVPNAYLVEITSIVPTHGASVFGTVSYTYTKIK